MIQIRCDTRFTFRAPRKVSDLTTFPRAYSITRFSRLSLPEFPRLPQLVARWFYAIFVSCTNTATVGVRDIQRISRIGNEPPRHLECFAVE